MPRFHQQGRLGGACLLFCACLANIVSATKPPITAVAFTPNGESLVAVSQDGLHEYSWPELTHKNTVEVSTSNLHCVAFSPNGQHLAVGGGYPSEEGVVKIFSWPEREVVATFDDHYDSVRSIAWRNDTRLLTASIDREIKLWDLESQAKAILTYKGHSRSVNAICMLSDGKSLVSAGVDHSLRVWDIESAKLLQSLNQHTKPVHDLAWRPSEETLPMVASAAGDRTIRFWQPTIGRMVRFVRLESEPLNIAWTNHGDRILAACMDGHVRVIDPIEVKVVQDLPAIDGWAYAIVVHPNDRSAAVGGTDGQIRRIKLSEPSEPAAIR